MQHGLRHCCVRTESGALDTNLLNSAIIEGGSQTHPQVTLSPQGGKALRGRWGRV